MQNEKSMIVIGIILVLSAAGIYAIGVSHMGVETVTIPGNGEKVLTYNLTSGNYTLAIHTSRQINYTLINEDHIVAQGNVSTQLIKKIGYLNGKCTLTLKNLNDNATVVAISLKSERSMMTLSTQVMASGGICLTGIIVGGVGAWLLMRRKKNVS